MSATLGHVDEPTPSPSNYDEKQDAEPPVSAFNFGLQSEPRKDDIMEYESTLTRQGSMPNLQAVVVIVVIVQQVRRIGNFHRMAS